MWRSAAALDSALDATSAIAAARTAIRTDLDAPSALAAIDAWASASLDVAGDDTATPALVATFVDAVLGIAL